MRTGLPWVAFVVTTVAAVATVAGCLGTSDSSPESNALLEAEVCAAGVTVKEIDVSYYQGTVDWNKAKAAGIDFAFARVSDGTNFVDPQFAANWPNMTRTPSA